MGAAPKKWVRKDELSKEWTSFIDNRNAQAGKNRTFHKTYKQNIPARLLTTGCNTAIENLAILVEKHCARLTENIPTKINDPYHLIDNFETLNAKSKLIMPFLIVTLEICLTNTNSTFAGQNLIQIEYQREHFLFLLRSGNSTNR